MVKDYLIDYYKKYFKKMLLPLGFKVKGRYFYRVVNEELIQAIGIKKHRLVRKFTINFDFGVFCMGGDPRYLAKDFMNFSSFLYEDDIWWEFDNSDEIQIKKQIEHVADEFQKILHIFSDIIDTQSYYDLIGNVERKVFGDTLEDGKIMICLKLKKYEEVIGYIKTEEEYNRKWLKDKLSLCKNDSEELESYKMAEEYFEPIRKIRDAILQKNYYYIDNLIKESENFSKQNCKDYLKIDV